ncbi:MAG: hypothetical protein K2J32_13190, partial [Ruminococcus sp.]|nr:hypothetical protein [Ruminococcus sp.]
TKNFSVLKKCEKFYSFIFWIYAVSWIPYACAKFIYAFFQGLALMNLMPSALNSLIALAIFSTGLISIHSKDPKYTWSPALIALISEGVSGFRGTYSLFLAISLVSSFLLTFIHKKYRWLEQQEGFPYFNEFFEEKKKSLAEFENKNNTLYQKNIEIYKNASHKMDEI